MYYLGIDPGVRKLGYAIIDKNLNIIDAGILLNEKKNIVRTDNFIRMIEIKNYFETLLNKYSIINAGIEKLFFTKYNKSNAEFVYGIRGILISIIISKGINIHEYSPIELKKMITGNGNAQKILVQTYIKKIFKLKNLPEYDDAADALGLAYLSINCKN